MKYGASNRANILKVFSYINFYVTEGFLSLSFKQIKLLNKCQLSGHIQILKWESIQV